MNSSPWCPARNLSLRLIYCNRGTALRRSARLPLLGWVSTALHPPPFFSSGRRHRLLLALCCLLGARATSVPPPRLASAKSFSELDSRRPCADPERALCRSRETARINFAEGFDFAEAPVNCAAVAHGSPARIDPSWPDFRRISGRNRPESTHSSRF